MNYISTVKELIEQLSKYDPNTKIVACNIEDEDDLVERIVELQTEIDINNEKRIVICTW
jgi:hypothetical protein